MEVDRGRSQLEVGQSRVDRSALLPLVLDAVSGSAANGLDTGAKQNFNATSEPVASKATFTAVSDGTYVRDLRPETPKQQSVHCLRHVQAF